jgi:hypothetical protein
MLTAPVLKGSNAGTFEMGGVNLSVKGTGCLAP